MTDDLPEVQFTVLGTATTHVRAGEFLCEIKAGSRVAQVLDGLVVAHPDDPPYLVRWDGTKEELKMHDGAIALPPLPPPELTINQTLRAMFETEGVPWNDEWGNDDDDLEDIYQ